MKLNKKEVLKQINSNPDLAIKALSSIYRNKTFAIVDSNRVDTFKKTKRGAEGYIKRQQSISYYDEYTHEMVTCGSGLKIEQINVNDILDPVSNIKIWYNYLKSIHGHDYLYNNAVKLANDLKVNDDVLQFIESTIEDMKQTGGFTIIDEYEQVEDAEETEVQQENQEEMQQTENKKIKTEANEQLTVTYKLNDEKQGIEIYFSEKPSHEVIETLKAYGFRWSKYRKMWFAKQSKERLQFVKMLVGETEQTKEITEQSEVKQESTQTKEVEQEHNTQQAEERLQTESKEQPKKIKVKSITFLWSESPVIKDNTTVSTWAEANKIIKDVAFSIDTEGYRKTAFFIVWEDNSTYEGRIDVQASDLYKNDPLSEHIENYAL